MRVIDLMGMSFIDDKTDVIVRDKEFRIIASGAWFDDHVLEYLKCNVDSFTWQDDNKVYITVDMSV